MFNVARLPGLLLDAPLHRLDLVDLGEAEVFAPDEALGSAEKFIAQGTIAGYGPNFDERLPLPGAAECVVIGQRAFERARHRPALAFGPQAQIDAVSLPTISMRRQQANQ